MLRKTKNFSYVLYVIALALIVCWTIGLFGYSRGSIIYVLLILAFLFLLFKVVKKRDELRINRMVKPAEETVCEKDGKKI